MAALHDYTLRQVLNFFRSGKLTVEHFMHGLVERSQKLSGLGAVMLNTLNHDALVAVAEKQDEVLESGAILPPLHGALYVVKDNINVAGMPTSCGTRLLAKHEAAKSARCVERLRRAGAVCMAKANMHELAAGVTCTHGPFGTVSNPYNAEGAEHLAGGSSGGTAAAVASRQALFGLGTDTVGSLRIPASLCGVAALRPTTGRYSGVGVMPISPSRDAVGAMARSVRDVALVDEILQEQQPASPLVAPPTLAGATFGLPRTPFYDDLDSETAAVMEITIRALRSRGAKFVDVAIPDLSELLSRASSPVYRFELRDSIEKFVRLELGLKYSFEDLVDQVSTPLLLRVLEDHLSGRARPPEDVYLAALNTHVPALQSALRECFAKHNIFALLYPTTPLPARPVTPSDKVLLNGTERHAFWSYTRNVDVGSCAGFPCLTLPVGSTTEGFPVGAELMSLPWADRALLQVGVLIEDALPLMPAPSLWQMVEEAEKLQQSTAMQELANMSNEDMHALIKKMSLSHGPTVQAPNKKK